MAPLTLAGVGCPPLNKGQQFCSALEPPWRGAESWEDGGVTPAPSLGALGGSWGCPFCLSPLQPLSPTALGCSGDPQLSPMAQGTPQLSSTALPSPNSAPWYECAMGTTSSAPASTSPLPHSPQPGCDQAPCESRNTLFLGQLWLPRDKGDTGGQAVIRDTASTGCVAPSMLQRGGVQVSP